MSRTDIPKTHYEVCRSHVEKESFQLIGKFNNDLPCGDDPTYEDMYRNIVPEESMKNRMYSSFIMSEFQLYFHLYHMYKSNEKIYYVTPNLASRLARTKLNVDTTLIKSPFREIFIQIDPGLFHILDAHSNGIKAERPVHGFYINYREIDGVKEVRVMAVSLINSVDRLDATQYFKLVLEPGKAIDVVDKFVEKSTKEQEEMLKLFGGASNIQFVREFTSFIFNVLLYTTSKDPDVIAQLPPDFSIKMGSLKSKGKKRKLKKRAERITSKEILVLGKNLPLNVDDTNNIKKSGSVGRWKLDHQVPVSGYWRVQHYGNREKDTHYSRVIWVEDYVKGPDLSDVVSKKVQVGYT